MNAGHLRRAGILTAVLAVGATGLASVGASAEGGPSTAAGGDALIKMKVKGKKLAFKGPDTVEKGASLDVVNKTNPMQVGPHTLSIVEENVLPKTKKKQKRCFKGNHICVRIAKAHKVDFQTGAVGRNPVEVGKAGWDRAFNRKGKKGDSWYTEEKGELFGQKVKAKPGTVLHYLCAIHPEMQGKIEVVK